MTATYDEALAPVGINVAQYSLLSNIERAAPVSLTALGRRMDLDRSTVGRNVRVLERMGLTRTQSGNDGREATVVLAEEGARVLSQGRPHWRQAQTRIEQALGPDTAAGLRNLLQTL